jgi:PTS system nitrogen regulatory IIA component
MLFDLPVEAIIPEMVSRNREEVLAELAGNLVRRFPELSNKDIVRILLEREQLGSTGIGDGVAIPHGKLKDSFVKPRLVLGRSIDGIEFNALDGRKVYIFFLILSPDADVGAHLKILAGISRILRYPAVRKELFSAGSAREIHSIIQNHGGDYS